jgi:hypothetical protein
MGVWRIIPIFDGKIIGYLGNGSSSSSAFSPP